MTLIVEDGTGIDGATGYISTEFYKDYHKARGNASTLSGGAIGALIIQATDYVEARWLTPARVTGDKLSETQGLSLPTEDIAINDTLRKAIAIYALEANTGSLYGAESQTGPVSKTENTVGPIKEVIEYDTTRATAGSTYRKFPEADLLMKRFLGLGLSKQAIRN